jgi:hypothetical protein
MKKLHFSLSFNPSKSKIPINIIEEANLEAAFISRLFGEYFEGLNILNLNRISIELVDDIASSIHVVPNLNIKVFHLSWKIDSSEYQSQNSKLEKYTFLLNSLTEAILFAAKSSNWSIEEFIAAKAGIMESKFKKTKIITKEKTSPNKKMKAKLLLEMKEKENHLSIKIEDKINSKNVNIFNLSIFEPNYKRLANSLKWLSNDEIEVNNEDNEIFFIYNLLNGNLNISLCPIIHTKEYLLEELKLMNSATSKEENQEILKKRMEVYSQYKVD